MSQKTFHILTFGCQMNVNDSFWLGRALQRRGFTEAKPGEALVTILNTCSVREKPELKVYNTLSRIAWLTRHLENTFCVVAGCVAQQIGADFFNRFPQVRLVVGGDGLPMAPEAIERLCREPDLRLNLTDFSKTYVEREPALLPLAGAVPLKANLMAAPVMPVPGMPVPGMPVPAMPVPAMPVPAMPAPAMPAPAVAYVNIMQGCDNFCAYCIVPYTRGRQKSRQPEAVLEECQTLLDNGAREITLLGQNVNAYGLDGDEPSFSATFPSLLQRIAALPGLERLRFVTPHPKDFSAEVVALFGTLGNLCPRLHLPLQSGSDRVLASMGRKYDRARFMQLVADLRAACPDLALSTDLIVGFPGETEEDFQQTLETVTQANFMSSFSFCYSDRPGTRAEKMNNKIEPTIKAQRLERLQTHQETLAQHWLESRVGLHTTVLLEGLSRKQPEIDLMQPLALTGQTEYSAPIESWQGRDPWGDTVNVFLAQGLGTPGRLVAAHITSARRHSLLAAGRV